MKFVIVSPKLGKPGAAYVPADGINIEALISGGFIKPAPTAPKPDKLETDPEKE